MAIDIFKIIKADRYTQDGRDEINKALNETEDAGLPDGTIRHRKDGDYVKQGGKWKPAPAGKAPTEKKNFDQRKFGTSPAAKEDAIRANIVARMTPEQREAVMNGRTLRTVKEGQGVIDITKEDLEFFDKHNAERNAAESKPAATSKFETEQEKSQYARGKEGWDKVDASRLPDIKKKVEQKIDYYKNYDPYTMVGKKSGLNAAQKKAVEQNMAQAKENLAFYTGQLEGINSRMESKDAAPRVLTGDSKIRVRKSK